ncbi:MAG: hypothetical protein WC663_05285 [Patescibacteria group bacterium]|jgi:hypothetical protein
MKKAISALCFLCIFSVCSSAFAEPVLLTSYDEEDFFGDEIVQVGEKEMPAWNATIIGISYLFKTMKDPCIVITKGTSEITKTFSPSLEIKIKFHILGLIPDSLISIKPPKDNQDAIVELYGLCSTLP